MKWLFQFTLVSLVALGPAQAAEGEGSDIIRFTPDQIEWKAGPDKLPGTELAVLEGDPAKKGIFTMRLRIPAGYEIKPHTHPTDERVTVLSGSINLGHGRKFDRNKGKRLEGGGYFAIMPETPHYAWTDEETVIQITADGP